MSRIGRAVIEVLLKGEQARAEARAVKQEVASIGDQAGSAGLDKAAGSAEIFSSGLLAAASAAVALGVGLAHAIDTWQNRSKDAQDELDKLTSGVHTLRDELAREAFFNVDTSAAEMKIQAIARKVQAAIGNMNESAGDGGFMANFLASFGITGQLDAKMKALYNSANQLSRVAAADTQRIREQQAKQDIKAAEDQKIARLDGIEKLYAEQKQKDDDLNRREQQAKTQQEKDAIAELRRQTDETFDYRRQKIRMEEQERIGEAERRTNEERARREAREIEAAERIAKRAADAWAREMERVTRAFEQSFAAAVSAQQAAANQSLDQVTADVSRIVDLISVRMQANGIDLRKR